MENRYQRHADIFDHSDVVDRHVTIIGCGAIGSNLAMQLAKMGFQNLHVYDFDEVDDVNLSSQFFKHTQIGMNKAEALKANIFDYEGFEINAYPEKFEDQSVGEIVVMAVDSIEAREAIFRKIRKSDGLELVLDGRMGSEQSEIYMWSPSVRDSMLAYRATLWQSGEVYRAPCTNKATTYCAATLAGNISAAIRNYIVEGEKLTPFRVTHFVPQFYIER